MTHNTPDTEWEKDLRIRYHAETLRMAEEVAETGDYSGVEERIVSWWLEKLSSRDTYWKERVDVEIRRKDKIIEMLLARMPKEQLEILNRDIDNLK